MEARNSGTVDVQDVKAVVVAALGIEERAASLTAETPLLGSMPELDSMAVLVLVAALEERFGIMIEDEDLTAEVFATIGSLGAFVASRL